MPAEVIMILNIALTGLAIYALVRLAQRRQKNRPQRKSEMDMVDDKIAQMANELKELDTRLKDEREQRRQSSEAN